MTPEEMARWVTRFKRQLRRADVVRCRTCSRDPRILAAIYDDAQGVSYLWIAAQRGLDGTTEAARAYRAYPGMRGHLVTTCWRCRGGLMLSIDGHGGIDTTRLGAPTRGVVQ